MERFRVQRSRAASFSSPSKVTTIIDRSSDGNHQSLKHKFQKSESGSSSRGSYRTILEHRLALEFGRSSSILPAGNLLKSLLADEMSTETESRRRTPTVIAKLMGLDRLPPQHGISKQPKRLSDGFYGKTLSAGTRSHGKSCNNQCCRKIAREEQLFKDVYEVGESLKGHIEGYASQVPPKRRHNEDEMPFVRQKFTHAKRLSTDEKLQNSKEFHDALYVLSSNHHLFLKFLQEPDSLFAKHLLNLHASPQPLCGNVRNLKVSDVLNCNINATGCQAGREASQNIDLSLSSDCPEGVHDHVSHRHAQDLSSPFEGKEAKCAAPTKIVLLKPNLGRSQKTTKTFSSSNSSCEPCSDVEMHTKKQTQARQREAKLRSKKRLPIELDYSAHKSRESRALAEEITQHVRSKLGLVSSDVPLSGYKGYSADESSHDMPVNDSSCVSDTMLLTPQTPHCSSSRGKSSSPHHAVSSVSREGEKRLSERWKMTHRAEEIQADKGTTLRDMLSMPDPDGRLQNLDGAIVEDGCSGSYDSNVKLSGSAEPMGISSRDAWKDGCIRSLSRSRSLPNAYDLAKNPESWIKHEGLGNERFLVPKQGARHGRKKAVNRDLSWKEGPPSGSRGLDDEKPHSSCHMSKEMVDDVLEVQVGGNGKTNVLEEQDSLELKGVILETPTFWLDTILNLDSMMGTEDEKISVSLNSGDDLLPAELSTNVQVKDSSCSSGLHESTPQNLAAQPESPTSNKEVDQPSPVSVLEAPFLEDLSSGSECFERVSAELHGLRMQLQLLKLETKEFGEQSLLISSDEEEGSTSSTELPTKQPTSTEAGLWEASYTAEVLAELGPEETDPNSCMTTWSSSESPMGPRLFERLENKYSGHRATGSRPDRRLLFDRIEYGLMQIVQRTIDPLPWVKTRSGTGPGSQWRSSWFEAELRRLLVAQASGEDEKEAESGMDLGVHIDGLGNEIEKMVLDELILESFTM